MTSLEKLTLMKPLRSKAVKQETRSFADMKLCFAGSAPRCGG